ncbi:MULTISPECIES: biotin-dependent carboxyltransferase family protein [Paraburkholderia]|uniref:5-oxoprolinase subunit C family protein n=1 Tax=Paraburkholderia TaxID=1822464 RepID=UPI002259A5FF|nr:MULTISPECIES: biotin-dependent carboxyltransferase family protein [Paraburkholderia]MCX4160195.1 biotin-dependent carboxyltransferase family protein [Paraburkholderia megapolitana]MDN7155694.1 biotin-dependent carboxyltransferase family protein [Paraburkholderia sp. CHISQ3]MDQ6492738.1 biotin-dependent carboxyltransferase family protein [Paraburkholderia megapolitana]
MPTNPLYAIEVVKPGLATSVQDTGRHGYYHVGIPPSGALDQYALRAANLLAGNPEGAAVLECTLLGPQLLFHVDTLIAVTGAEMQPKIDGVAHACNVALRIKAGSTLTFDYVKGGARACLAVAGGIDVPVVLGSRSTYTLGAFGGHEGRRLQKGDQLRIGKTRGPAREGTELPEKLRTPLAREVELRVLPGLYFHRLTDESSITFYEDTWTVAPEADRIGYRYKQGRPLKFREREQPFGAGSDPSNIVDACYPIGSIQVPAGLEPIILHLDAVSGGGYATIGTVISADMDLIGQMQPNHQARFLPVTMTQALAARRDAQLRLARLREVLLR